MPAERVIKQVKCTSRILQFLESLSFDVQFIPLVLFLRSETFLPFSMTLSITVIINVPNDIVKVVRQALLGHTVSENIMP